MWPGFVISRGSIEQDWREFAWLPRVRDPTEIDSVGFNETVESCLRLREVIVLIEI